MEKEFRTREQRWGQNLGIRKDNEIYAWVLQAVNKQNKGIIGAIMEGVEGGEE